MIAICMFLIVLYGAIKKVDLYNEFIKGIKEGIQLILEITPTLLSFVLAIYLFTESNLLDFLLSGIPKMLPNEIISMLLVRSISGNASLALMQQVFLRYGIESFPASLASVIQGCTDTTLYVFALYFSSIKIKKTKHALKTSLFADLCGMIASIVLSYLFLK